MHIERLPITNQHILHRQQLMKRTLLMFELSRMEQPSHEMGHYIVYKCIYQSTSFYWSLLRTISQVIFPRNAIAKETAGFR